MFCQLFKEMDKIRIMGFHQPPTILFDDPHTQTTPLKFHSFTSKGCRNDLIEAFIAVYWAKKLLNNLRGLQQTPFGGRGLKLKFSTYMVTDYK